MTDEAKIRQDLQALVVRLHAAHSRKLLHYERYGLNVLVTDCERWLARESIEPSAVEALQCLAAETLNGISVRQGMLPVGEAKLRQLLLVAAEVLEVADDWGLPSVEMLSGLVVPEGCESTGKSGRWCSTGKLARRLREVAEGK